MQRTLYSVCYDSYCCRGRIQSFKDETYNTITFTKSRNNQSFLSKIQNCDSLAYKKTNWECSLSSFSILLLCILISCICQCYSNTELMFDKQRNHVHISSKSNIAGKKIHFQKPALSSVTRTSPYRSWAKTDLKKGCQQQQFQYYKILKSHIYWQYLNYI